jgi:recombination protein RecT
MPAQTVSSALAKRQSTIGGLIEGMKPQIARALPKHMEPDRLARIALTVVRQNPKLAECNPESFLGALMTCAQLGLEPGPLGHAYLVPYGQEVTFIPGYRGLIELARRSGIVRRFVGRAVHANDEFDYAYGLYESLTHKPALGEPGDFTFAYAVLWVTDADPDFEVMNKPQIDAIRARSRAGKNGPWVTDYEEMAKKTVIRRLAKRAPMSIEFVQAVNNDENVRTSIDIDALDVTPVVEDEAPGAETVEVKGKVVDTASGEIVEDKAEPAEWPPVAEPGSRGSDAK